MGTITTVNFRGDTLYAVERDDGHYVALKPMVEGMGMNWSGQQQRVQRDPILSEGICMTHTPFGSGGGQEVLCLKVDLINGWLFTIDTNRIKDEEVRARVLMYQRECYSVLSDHFQGKARPVPESVHLDGDQAESEGVKLRMVTEGRQTFGSQAAAQLWFKLGLPIVPAMQDAHRQLTFIDYTSIKDASTEAA